MCPTMTHTYHTAHCRSVAAESSRAAAEIFAARLARRSYGRRAYARTLNCNGYCPNGTFTEWAAFVGYRSGPNETTGHDEIFTVRASK